LKAALSIIIWTVAVTVMSLAPVYEASTYKFFPHEDKLAHAIMYFVMAYLLGLLIPRKNSWSFFLIFLIPALYGFFMEILQDQLDTGRMFDYLDILANIFGSFTGTMLIYVLFKREV